MTTNDLIKCPVCGTIDENFHEDGIEMCIECSLPKRYWPEINSSIAAAVIAERERIVYGIWQGFTHEGGGCDNNLYTTIEAAQNRIIEIVKEEESGDMPDDCIWIKIEDDNDIGGWHMAKVDKDNDKDIFEYETIALQQFNVS